MKNSADLGEKIITEIGSLVDATLAAFIVYGPLQLVTQL